jgi:catechol 2,3-dioxygenase-like lactoylglutathione lyase family enzyme
MEVHMVITHLDHLVLTVENLQRTCNWYSNVLGMKPQTFGNGRQALHIGTMKINLHLIDTETAPKAPNPGPGTADLCFITEATVEEIGLHLAQHDVPILQGPVERTGATGPITSYYVYDPDQNLIEIATYHDSRRGVAGR